MFEGGVSGVLRRAVVLRIRASALGLAESTSYIVSARTNLSFRNMKVPKLPLHGSGALLSVGVVGDLGVYTLNNDLENVEGGSRAIVFNCITGIKDKVYPEGTDLIIPWFERPIIYDVHVRPHEVNSIAGSRYLQMV